VKILLVNYEYLGQGGGAGQQMYYLAQALKDLKHDVSLMIGWDNKTGTPKLIDGVTMYIVKHKRKNVQLSTPTGMALFVLRGLLCINRLTRGNNYDIIQFYFSVPTGILSYGIHGNIPYIISLRGMDIPGLQKDRNRGLSILTSALNKRISRKAAAVICNSNESAIMYNRFIPDISIKVIHNTVSPQIKYKKTYSDSVTSFITIGRLIPWKRIDLLISAVVSLRSKYPEITLDIYGQGYQYYELQNHILKKNAGEYIKLKGYIDREQLLGTLHTYDAFVFASTGDSCPNVLIEAMASGLPIVAARSGGAIDIVEEGITGLFSIPGDLDDTIKKIEYCIKNPDIMKKYGLNGRKRVEERYSVEGMGKQHIDEYKKIVVPESE